jgi:hypothetical protein
MSHKIDTTKGEMSTAVSRQWYSRPADQRFLSLSELHAATKALADASRSEPIKPHEIAVHFDAADATPGGPLSVSIEGQGVFNMTHYAFNRMAQVAKAPPGYLRRLPTPLLAANLRYGLRACDQSNQHVYLMGDGENGSGRLRTLTSERYGRIFDHDLVEAIMKIAGDGTGDTMWKVPGCIDWSSMTYNSEVDITKDTTTLYGSDRDVFVFLVNDRDPVEVGTLADGSPDLMFQGFYAWNSEVGERTMGAAEFWLRGVCQNRCLWGLSDFKQVVYKHTSGAPARFVEETKPAFDKLARVDGRVVREAVKAAKAAVVSKTDEERLEFLSKLGFSKDAALGLIVGAVKEEGHPPESVWDHAQAITAKARSITYQGDRVVLEGVAGKLLEKVTD